MITANDLKNIDTCLSEQQRIINQSNQNTRILTALRIKISQELKKLKIKTKRRAKK